MINLGTKSIIPINVLMIRAIIWNIRGMRSKGAFERLLRLVKLHKINFIALQEPFLNPSRIEEYKNSLGFDHAISNNNSKIWCFWDTFLNCELIVLHSQQMTFKVSTQGDTDYIWITTVYAKSNYSRRRRLWRSLRSLHTQINGPWTILGDFNSILYTDEKK